jgi:hypothetical protein
MLITLERQRSGGLQDQLGQKVSKTPSQSINLGMVVLTCHPNYMGGINKKIVVHTLFEK